MSQGNPFKVGDIVRDARDGADQQLLRVAALYDGCDELVVEVVDDPDDSWDALWWDLELAGDSR